MSESSPSPETLFAAALALAQGKPRREFLDQACAGRDALRDEVESLLAAHDAATGFLETQRTEASSARAVDAIPGPGDRIGRYRLLERIGEGGFGVVWMAEQEEPVRRRVALKIIKPGMDTREVIARFEAERQALALMDHPGIARVFDGGATATGRPYFVMELVKGIPITTYCDENKLATRARLELFREVCHAVQHAHQKGVIHRDLKPSNVLVTEQDGRPVPKVIDFGVAKATGSRLTDKTMFTRLHQLVGTPAYMSPEQAGLESQDVDTRSDVYSLGVLLYELVTGRTPFDTRKLLEAGFEAVLRTIREAEPPKPSTRLSTLHETERLTLAAQRQTEPSHLRRLVEGDLDWIVMKALEKDRRRRYETPHAFAQDVLRHLDGEPVAAGPPGAGYRLRKFVRRNKLMVTATAAVGWVIVVAGAISAWQWRQTDQARRGETNQRQAAEANAAENRARLVQLDVANGVRAQDHGDGFGALLWFAEAFRQDRPDPQRESVHRTRLGTWMRYAPRLAEMWFHDKAVNGVSLSPDGRHILTGSADGTARIWDLDSGQPGPVFPHGTNVALASFSGDGRRVLTLSRLHGVPVRVWDAASGQPAGPPLEHPYRVAHAVLSPDGSRVFTLGDPAEPPDLFTSRPDGFRGELRIWDVATGKQVRAPFERQSYLPDLALSSDGQWLALTLCDSVMVWNLADPQGLHFVEPTNTPPVLLPGLARTVANQGLETLLPALPAERRSSGRLRGPTPSCLAFSPDNQRLLIAYGDGTACLRTLPTGTPRVLQTSTQPRASSRPTGWQSASFTPDGRRVILVDGGGLVRFWDTRTGEAEGQLEKTAGDTPVLGPDSRLAFAAGRVWDVRTGKPVSLGPLHFSATSAVFTADGARIITAGADGTVRLWLLAGPTPPLPPFRHDWPAVAGTSSTADPGQPANLRQQMEQAMLRELKSVQQVAFSPDGERALTVSANGSARVWDTRTGAAVSPFVTMPGPLEAGAFSPDGSRFVLAGGFAGAGIVRIWRTDSAEPRSPLIPQPEAVRAAAFSPDGRWLIIESAAQTCVLDASTGERVLWPVLAGRTALSIAFSPNARQVAISSLPQNASSQGAHATARATGSGEIRLYDPATWRPIAPPLAETNQIREMRFSPDGRWLVTLGVRSGKTWVRGLGMVDSIRVWDTASGQPLAEPAAGFVCAVEFTRRGDRLFVLRVSADPLIWDLVARRRLDPDGWRGLRTGAPGRIWDGRRLAVRVEEMVRVMDSVSREPLSPPLPTPCERRGAPLAFSPAGDLVLLGDEQAQFWPLREAVDSAENLLKQAELLAGRRIGASGDFEELPVGEASRAWRQWQTRDPFPHALAPRQLRIWREAIVEAAEKDGDDAAAIFHLEQLVRENPSDATLRLRRAQARNRLATDELANRTSGP